MEEMKAASMNPKKRTKNELATTSITYDESISDNNNDKTGQGISYPSKIQTASKCSSCQQLYLSGATDRLRCDHCIVSVATPLHEHKIPSCMDGAGSRLTPSVNDVLIGRGPSIFNHVGNRRFRVLVEANFHSYFNCCADEGSRDKIVDDIIGSVMGNVPGGRFLVGSTASDAIHDVSSIVWKHATRVQAEAKVHSAFLAAGYFLVAKADMFRKYDDVKQQQIKQPKMQPADCQCHKDNQTYDTSSDLTIATTSSNSHGSTVSSNASETSESKTMEEKSNPNITSLTVTIPVRIREFVLHPVSKYFVPDVPKYDSECCNTLSPNKSTSFEYLTPSTYDILCGMGQNYFHHIGNRRFRIMIEMNVDRYRQLVETGQDIAQSDHDKGQHTDTKVKDTVENLINETLASLSKCNPPGRFLGLDLSTGKWRTLNSKFAALKTEQLYFECRKVQMQIEERNREMEKTLIDLDAEVDSDAIANAKEELFVTTSEGQGSKMNASHACNGHNNMLCSIPPLPSFGIDISTMQTRARRMLRGTTRTLEYVDMTPSNGDLRNASSKNNLSVSHPTPAPLTNLSQFNSQQCATGFSTQHGTQKSKFAPSSVPNSKIGDVADMLESPEETDEAVSKRNSMSLNEMKTIKASPRAISEDIMDVVGGMLSLSASGKRRQGSR